MWSTNHARFSSSDWLLSHRPISALDWLPSMVALVTVELP